MGEGPEAAGGWFEVERVDGRLTVVTEPHVHPFLRANVWHLRGSRRDLVVDTGLGVAALRAAVPDLLDRETVIAKIRTYGYTVPAAAETAPLRFHVQGMDCADCARSLEAAVSALPGVASAQVSFGAATLVVMPISAADLITSEITAASQRDRRETRDGMHR